MENETQNRLAVRCTALGATYALCEVPGSRRQHSCTDLMCINSQLTLVKYNTIISGLHAESSTSVNEQDLSLCGI